MNQERLKRNQKIINSNCRTRMWFQHLAVLNLSLWRLQQQTAAKYLGKAPERIEAKVSPNLMKNGLGVAVPGTGMVGLPIAAELVL